MRKISKEKRDNMLDNMMFYTIKLVEFSLSDAVIRANWGHKNTPNVKL